MIYNRKYSIKIKNRLSFFTYIDIDECSLNKNVCHPNAKCDNTIGSFECHCISGYTGDGCNCTGKQ